MNVDLRSRACNAMFGLALGDALSWPAMFHRSYLLPFWTRRIRREIEAATENTNALPLAMPFSLNRSDQVFLPGPTDDSEWAAFTMQQLLQAQGELEAESLLKSWLLLAESDNIRGSIGIQAALQNLRKGKSAPTCGYDNPHYFDDGALCRAVPIGIANAGNPQMAADMAAIDAQITNAEDGLWAAKAMAAAISTACIGHSSESVIAHARAELPENSWINRTVQQALSLCETSESTFELIPLLHETIINREYNYGNIAPETMALTLAILRHTQGQFEAAVMMATTFAKTADSVPACAGALCGAMTNQAILTPLWQERLRALHGICIPALAGVNFIDLVEQLAGLAVARSAA
ncbi:MAG: ADP-ribosylglycohydrolase family protein [bacterium]